MKAVDFRMFHAVHGRGLMPYIPQIAAPPYLVVTMEDLWPNFKKDLETEDCRLYFVKSLEANHLNAALHDLPLLASVVGVGGGVALDVAKYFSWRKNLPLFQVPTSMSVNCQFTYTSLIWFNGKARYVGYAIPEVVYVDYDVIKSAPAHLNRASVGDIFCIHTALYDWQLASERGQADIWPFDAEVAAEAQEVLQRTRAKARDIHDMTDEGIRTVLEVQRWTGVRAANQGWNRRPSKGSEHLFFYSLEQLTQKRFVHGEAVSLGIVCMSHLQENDPEGIWQSIEEVGVRVRPEELGVTWQDVAIAFKQTRAYTEREGLFYTVVNEREVTDEVLERVRERLS
jgi:glycerol-1-phosphate dehydrogenase [NAD(P)+]